MTNLDKEIDQIIRDGTVLRIDDGQPYIFLTDTAVAKIQALIKQTKIDTLKITHGHQQTGTTLNDEYFIHNITMLERELGSKV